jgi:hypothetical protein
MVKYKVTLSKKEREQLMNIIQKGSHSSQLYHTAYILLHSDESRFGKKNKMIGEHISKFLLVSSRMIDRVKRRFIEDGFEDCLERKPLSRTKERKFDGNTEAHLVALSCSKAPEGFARWSLRLLADKMVELKYVESISYETIRKTLKKTN